MEGIEIKKDIKKTWWDKGWLSCSEEFKWRLKFLFEKDEANSGQKYWRILEIIEKLKK